MLEKGSKLSSNVQTRLVIHVGSGIEVPDLAGCTGRPLKPNEVHFLCEPKKVEAELIHEQLKNNPKLMKQVFLFPFKVEDLALDSENVDEFHIHDVFNDPEVDSEQRHSIFQTVSRLAKPSVEVYVSNLRSPVFPKDDLARLASEHGFRTEFLVSDSKTPRMFLEHRPFREHEVPLIREYLGDLTSKASAVTPGYYLAKLTRKTPEELAEEQRAAALEKKKSEPTPWGRLWKKLFEPW